jgi:hypothetical protein
MKPKLLLAERGKAALQNALRRAVDQNQICQHNRNCSRAPERILRILEKTSELNITPCHRCAIEQFVWGLGVESEREGLVEVFAGLFDVDENTADKILGRLNS